MALLRDDVYIDFSKFSDGCITGLTLEEIDDYLAKIENEERLKSIEMNIQEAHSCLDNTSTATQTKFYVRKFKEFLQKEGLDADFESQDNKTLLKYLQYWLLNSKRTDGKNFKPQTYNCMKAAIHRHVLTTNGRSIIGNPDFEQLKITQSACTTRYLEEPRTTEERESGYKDINEKDMTLINTYFNRSDPVRLQREVIFKIIWHFGFRGREWLRGLDKHSVIFSKCPTSGLKYVDLKKSQMSKCTNYKKPKERKCIVMFEKPGDERCPVKLMKDYIDLIPATVTCLFPKPLKNFLPGRWYSDKMVVGKNTLDNVMKNISKDASLSMKYTNHCIRSSVVTSLSDVGVPPQDIQIVTGHEKLETIDHYTKKINVSKRIRLSHTLTECLGGNREEKENMVQKNVNVEIVNDTETEEVKRKHPVAVLEKDGMKLSFFM